MYKKQTQQVYSLTKSYVLAVKVCYMKKSEKNTHAVRNSSIRLCTASYGGGTNTNANIVSGISRH